MQIILAGPYPAGTAEKFGQLLPGNEIVTVTDQAEYEAMTEGDVIVVRVLKTPASVLAPKKDLKAVIRWGAGYDSVDIEAAGKQGVFVANMPGVNAYAVAELAVGLMIAAGRKVIDQNRLTHDGIWDNKLYAPQMTSLNHKTVGVIGGGNIGRKVATEVQSFGANVIYYDAFRLSEEREKETGACFAGVRGGNHYGYAGYYAQMAAKEGMIGIANSNAASACAPYGGKEPMLGTNPLAIAIPSANREPFLLDMATSLVARGKVKLAEKDGRPIPEDWALDTDGNPTTDPSKAKTMVPCGGYKGFGISLAIEILCSALSGAKTSATVGELYDLSGCHQDLGFFFGALNVGGVTDLNRFENSVDSLITSMKESPKAAGVDEIFVAGEIENRKQKTSQAEGVNISDAVIRELREVSEMSGIPFECEF